MSRCTPPPQRRAACASELLAYCWKALWNWIGVRSAEGRARIGVREECQIPAKSTPRAQAQKPAWAHSGEPHSSGASWLLSGATVSLRSAQRQLRPDHQPIPEAGFLSRQLEAVAPAPR